MTTQPSSGRVEASQRGEASPCMSSEAPPPAFKRHGPSQSRSASRRALRTSPRPPAARLESQDPDWHCPSMRLTTERCALDVADVDDGCAACGPSNREPPYPRSPPHPRAHRCGIIDSGHGDGSGLRAQRIKSVSLPYAVWPATSVRRRPFRPTVRGFCR